MNTKSLSRFLKDLLGTRVETYHVNRETIIVKPKEPFIQWVINRPRAKELDIFTDPASGQTIDLTETPEEIRQSLSVGHSAYLLPNTGNGILEVETLRAVYKTIFECELRDWQHIENHWPKNRSYELFLEWFEISYHESTYDLCKAPLERELWDDSI